MEQDRGLQGGRESFDDTGVVAVAGPDMGVVRPDSILHRSWQLVALHERFKGLQRNSH